MTEERTLTDTVPGGGTVDLGVTATATNLEIESMVQSMSRFHANAVHAQLAEQTARWRERLYEMREELGGEPAPEPRASDLPRCPMPGRMRTWTAPDGLWVMFVSPGRSLDLDQVEMVRVPVSAIDTDADLEAAAERWLTGYGCPPEGTVAWMLPQLRQHRNRLAENAQRDRQALSPRPMTPAERARLDAAVIEARERPAAAMQARRAPRLTTLVLYVADVEAAADWYRSALSIVWTRERHGDGPEHVSTDLGGTVIELYPASERHPVSRVRVELTVPDMFGDADRAPDGFPRRLEDLDGSVVVVNLR